MIQILIKKFPKSLDRLKGIEVDTLEMSNITAYIPISEHERRQEHISEVDPESPFLRVALNCLKDKDVDQQTALWLCERMVGLKDTAKYRESLATGCMIAQNEHLSTNRNGRQ